MTTDTILAKNPRYFGAKPKMTVEIMPLGEWNEPTCNMINDARTNAAKVTLLEPAFGEVVEALKTARAVIKEEWRSTYGIDLTLEAATEVTKQLEGLK